MTPTDPPTGTNPAAAAIPSGAPCRIAIVGCGTVGDVHRQRLIAEPDVEIVAVCDPDADALSRMAARLPRRPRLFRSEQDLLAAGVADAIVLCTPHARHAVQVRAAVGAGVHILCEKPFVTTEAEARELVARAQERGIGLFVAFTRRSRGHARFLQSVAERIGPLTHVAITRAQPWLQTHRRTWRVRADEGGGFLVDNGASMIDLLLRLVNHSTVMHIDAELQRHGGTDVDVRGSIRLTFLNGTRADLTFLGDATERVERIQLFGERGTAGWMLREDAPHTLYVRPDGGPSQDADAAQYRTLLPDAAFVAALRSGRGFGADTAQDMYSAATAVPVVALVERIAREAVWK